MCVRVIQNLWIECNIPRSTQRRVEINAQLYSVEFQQRWCTNVHTHTNRLFTYADMKPTSNKVAASVGQRHVIHICVTWFNNLVFEHEHQHWRQNEQKLQSTSYYCLSLNNPPDEMIICNENKPISRMIIRINNCNKQKGQIFSQKLHF